MIDIDSSIQAIESHPTFWVRFSLPSQEGEFVAFEVKASPRQQRRIIDRYIRVAAALPSTEFTEKEAPRTMDISADWPGMALALAEYIIGWEGFHGDFNLVKVRKWLELYSNYAIAFAQQFKGVLDTYESAMIRRKDTELKN